MEWPKTIINSFLETLTHYCIFLKSAVEEILRSEICENLEEGMSKISMNEKGFREAGRDNFFPASLSSW